MVDETICSSFRKKNFTADFVDLEEGRLRIFLETLLANLKTSVKFTVFHCKNGIRNPGEGAFIRAWLVSEPRKCRPPSFIGYQFNVTRKTPLVKIYFVVKRVYQALEYLQPCWKTLSTIALFPVINIKTLK